MKGKIRTKEKCSVCKGKFKELPRGIVCTRCGTSPKKYFIDLGRVDGNRIKLYSDKNGQRFDSYRRTVRTLEAIRYEIDNGTFDPSQYVAKDLKEYWFEKQAVDWFDGKKRQEKRGDLAPGYLKNIKTYTNNYFISHFGNKDVREIRAKHIDNFLNSLPEGFSDKHRKNILNALDNFFNYLLKYQVIDRKPPFPTISVNKVSSWEWVDVPEQNDILRFIYERFSEPHADVPKLIEILTETGLRPGEGRALKVKDFNSKDKTLRICRTFSERQLRETTKGRRIDVLPLTESACTLLQETIRNKSLLPEAFIFTTKSGKVITENRLRKVWSEVRGHFRLNMRLYDFTRHSLPSQLVENETPLPVIQKIMRHADIRTTMKYTHVNLDHIRSSLERRKGSKVQQISPGQKKHDDQPDK